MKVLRQHSMNIRFSLDPRLLTKVHILTQNLSTILCVKNLSTCSVKLIINHSIKTFFFHMLKCLLYILACVLVKIKSSTAFFGVPTGTETLLWVPQFGVIFCYTFLFLIHINTKAAAFTLFISL
jgi:hypothetical protein